MKQLLIKCNIWKKTFIVISTCHISLFFSFDHVQAKEVNHISPLIATGSNSKKIEIQAHKLKLDVKSAILMEAITGEVIVDLHSDIAYPPASMTKMMTEYIVMQKVKSGELSWDDEVVVKKNAAITEGSRIFIAEGDKHKVKDLYIAMAIGSANDATVALAEHISGSESQFVKLMNDTAYRLGMTKTNYVNSTGLDWISMPKEFRPKQKIETMMSAMDIAKLVRAIVVDHHEFKDFTTIQSFKFRNRDKTPITNLNWMLESNKNIINFKRYAYPGLDGMKTGFTDDAKYCFAGTAIRNDMRLISVVMGAKSKGDRFVETAKLLNYGYDHFELNNEIAPKKVIPDLETIPIKKGVQTEVAVVTETGVGFLIPKGKQITGNIKQEVKLKPAEKLVAPIKKGQQLGTVTFIYKDKSIEQRKVVHLIATNDVETGSWWRLFFRAFVDFFVDLFKAIKNLF